MSRKKNLFVWIPVLMVALLAVGCPKKQPTPPNVTEPEEAPMVKEEMVKEVEAPPPPVVDEKPDWYSDDLAELNRNIRERGLLGDVYFSYDSYELAASARDRLAKNADFMRAHPEYTFLIEGHCDERGTNEYNLALGGSRANGAKNYIGSLGINASRMNTVSYGEEQPVCSTAAESCWQRNRRAAFIVAGGN